MLGEVGQLFDAIEEEANAIGIPVVASAVDTHGNMVLLMRMTNAPVHSVHMATRKAFTAISMGVETASLTAQVQPGQPLFGLTAASGGQLVPFGGGNVVTLAGGERIGVGISGGTTEQDMEVLARSTEKLHVRMA